MTPSLYSDSLYVSLTNSVPTKAMQVHVEEFKNSGDINPYTMLAVCSFLERISTSTHDNSGTVQLPPCPACISSSLYFVTCVGLKAEEHTSINSLLHDGG